MIVELDPTTRIVQAYGLLFAPGNPNNILLEVNDRLIRQIDVPGEVMLNVDGTISRVPGSVLPPPVIDLTPPPNINGLVTALMASASIDQSTKDALVRALKGNNT